jgi:hypothetical protein
MAHLTPAQLDHIRRLRERDADAFKAFVADYNKLPADEAVMCHTGWHCEDAGLVSASDWLDGLIECAFCRHVDSHE